MRAHLYRPIQNNQGDIRIGSVVRVLQPGTESPIIDPLYINDFGPTTLSNPFTTNSGMVDFYLEVPQRIRLGIKAGNEAEYFIDDIDLLLPLSELPPHTHEPTGPTNDSEHNGTPDDTTQVGTGALALGPRSTVVGDLAVARADDGTAVGYRALGTGSNPTAYGVYAVAGDPASVYNIEFGYWQSGGDNDTALGSYSLAIGGQAAALGTYTQAWGDQAVAVGYYAIAGDQAFPSDDNRNSQVQAMGNTAQAHGSQALAIGNTAGAYGYQAMAMGNSSTATSHQGLAVGNTAMAGQTFSEFDAESTYGATALGNTAQAKSSESTALGSSATAVGKGSLAIGYSATVGDEDRFNPQNSIQHHHSTAIGNQATTDRSDQAVIRADILEVDPSSNIDDYSSPGASTLVLRSANGTRWQITVSDAGVLSTAVLPAWTPPALVPPDPPSALDAQTRGNDLVRWTWERPSAQFGGQVANRTVTHFRSRLTNVTTGTVLRDFIGTIRFDDFGEGYPVFIDGFHTTTEDQEFLVEVFARSGNTVAGESLAASYSVYGPAAGSDHSNSNTLIEDAVVLTPGDGQDGSYSNSNFHTQIGEPDTYYARRTAWYKFTATKAERVTLDTTPAVGLPEITLDVWKDTNPNRTNFSDTSNFISVSNADSDTIVDPSFRAGFIGFDTEIGTTYYVRLSVENDLADIQYALRWRNI